MNISDALSILGRSGVGGGGGGGGGGGRKKGQQSTTLPPAPPPARAPVPAAAYAPAVAAYRPPAAVAAAASGKQHNTNANANSNSNSSDPRSLAATLDAAVISSLAPAVAFRLRAVHGDLWLDVLPEPLPWRTPEAVLSVLKSTWRSSFDNGYASSTNNTKARAAAAVESLPKSLRAARAGSGPAVSEAACALADLVRDFPSKTGAGGGGSGNGGNSEEAAAVAAALARARGAAAAAASKAASAGWM